MGPGDDKVNSWSVGLHAQILWARRPCVLQFQFLFLSQELWILDELLTCMVADEDSPEDLGHFFSWTEPQIGPSSPSTTEKRTQNLPTVTSSSCLDWNPNKHGVLTALGQELQEEDSPPAPQKFGFAQRGSA